MPMVLHRANVRDVLLRTARAGVFLPMWSDDILIELARSLQRRGYTGAQSAGLDTALRKAFRHAVVTGHHALVPSLTL